MAHFKKHITLSSLISLIVSVICISLLHFVKYDIVVFMTICIFLGAMLPDLDSWSSIGFRTSILVISLIISFSWSAFLFSNRHQSLIITLIHGILVFLAIYLGVGKLITKITKHRGMMHSIPAVFIAFFSAFNLFQFVIESFELRLLFSTCLAGGYLSHLLLDVLTKYNRYEADQYQFTKDNFPLKLYVKNKKINILAYTILFILILISFPQWMELKSNPINFYKTEIKK